MQNTAEYQEGFTCWQRCLCRTPYVGRVDERQCPYRHIEDEGFSDKRTRWMAGWWGGYVTDWLERFEARHGRE
jgi:hypothetical protein